MSDPNSLERQLTNGQADLERLSPDAGSPDFFEIQIPHRPVPIRIQYAAIVELQRQLAGEGESVGLLLGTSTPNALAIQRCEVLAVAPGASGDPKLLQGAFRKSLEARSQNGLADASQLLGCFRTQVAGWPGMKEADLGMVKRAFPGSDSFFILIRTTRHRPWLAALYSLDAKTTTLSVEPALEFPFDEYLLRKGYLTDLVETPEAAEVQAQPKKIKNSWIVAGLVFAVLLAGSAAAYKFKWFMRSDQTETAGKNAPGPALNLKVNRSGKDFEVSWDRFSAAVQQASGGMLTISDGALTRPVALNGAQLREGRILYTPLFEELNFRLEVVTPELGTAAESVQVLAWSGKQPADVLAVAPAGPLANAPPRVVAKAPLPPPTTPLPASPKPATPAPKSATTPASAQPPAAKQTQPARPPSAPETVAVVQPSPSNPATSTPLRVPDVVPPAPAPERPPAAQPSPQVPVNTQPAQPPAAPAPKPEAPPVSQTPATISTAPSPPSNPVPATPTYSARIAPPVPIQRVAALMPRNVPAASTAGVTRIVSVRVMVDSAGSVQSAEVTASSPKGSFGEALLKNAALDAAKKWKFQPGQVNGKNVAAEYSIDFKF